MMMGLAIVTIELFDDVDTPIFPPYNWQPELLQFGSPASIHVIALPGIQFTL